MKKTISIVMGLATVAALLSGCGASEEVTPTVDWEDTYVPIVSITGKLVPALWAGVSAQVGGLVVEVAVEPGDEVAAGALLVRLDDTDAHLAVSQAEAALAVARAQLARLQEGARPEEIAIAGAQVEAARAALSQAVALRDQIESGATDAQIAAARAQLAAAQAEQLVARDTHDETLKCFTLPGGSKVCPLLGTIEQQANYALHAADEALAAAQANLEATLQGADGQLRAADAAVWAAAAQRDVAQAQLEMLEAGPTDAEIAAAEAGAAQAEAALEAARVALARTGIRAPFDGTVGAVYVRVGEMVVPGQALATIGDLSTLRVETTDLDEIDVASVAEGQAISVDFDALPEHVLGGRVVRISPMADPGAGGVSYTAIIELDEVHEALRWGMTAFVDIEVVE
jgi:multidrug efflux pump subunit AcrA (membrane-fusion protein)